ncbi:hypothetical protein B296_00040322 [Ensete ventricosum]|uniref:Phosphotransferase n=1 Tax=Ensete ventricosum TaxID=4639 RepID=A0A426XTY9_ENSVE|nr:hypothetical protein B296_00040322 [Ensete ventricosum]
MQLVSEDAAPVAVPPRLLFYSGTLPELATSFSLSTLALLAAHLRFRSHGGQHIRHFARKVGADPGRLFCSISLLTWAGDSRTPPPVVAVPVGGVGGVGVSGQLGAGDLGMGRMGLGVAAGCAVVTCAIAAALVGRRARSWWRWARVVGVVGQFEEDCATPVWKLRQVVDAMVVEMHAGLASDGGSKLKMLLTFVDTLPDG